MSNYLDPECNPRFKNHLQQKKIKASNQFETGRAYGIKKIIELHAKKGYRLETLFAAQGIFDRYLARVGHWNFDDKKYVLLATISVLMSAKLE